MSVAQDNQYRAFRETTCEICTSVGSCVGIALLSGLICAPLGVPLILLSYGVISLKTVGVIMVTCYGSAIVASVLGFGIRCWYREYHARLEKIQQDHPEDVTSDVTIVANASSDYIAIPLSETQDD